MASMNASPSPARPPQHLLRGKSPFFACTADRRFLFAVYTPTTHDPNSDPPLPLVVALHGAARDMRLLDRMGEWAESARCAVLAPLFPCGADDYDDTYAYGSLLSRSGTRYDLVLLAMIEQAAHTWPVRTERFLLHGFSAGGQFAHRFAYLHAHRLAGVSIGAPGKITLPARTVAWPSGVRDLRAIFGADVQWDTLKRVPAHFVVGEKDTTPQRAADDGDDARMLRTRIENVHALRDAWHEEGLACRLDVVAGVGHSGLKCLGPVFEFFTPLVASMHTRNIT